MAQCSSCLTAPGIHFHDRINTMARRFRGLSALLLFGRRHQVSRARDSCRTCPGLLQIGPLEQSKGVRAAKSGGSICRSSLYIGRDMAGGFLPWHEPSIVEILIVISFFFFLSLARWLSAKLLQAGIIGQIAVGIIYGVPLANILEKHWQQTFLVLGYVGLILIIFEGGLNTRLDLLQKNFILSSLGALTGVILPISFSYLLLYLGFGYGAVETFIVGAALSATSLGTTFAVISSASDSLDLSNTRVGAVLVSAAVIDDVIGLVLSSIIADLSELSHEHQASLGWIVGRPLVASFAMAILTPILTKYFFAPVFRRYIEHAFSKYNHVSNIILMVLVLCAFITIAAYTGTSILFGAFLAGTFLIYIPRKKRGSHGPQACDRPTFGQTFDAYLLDVQTYLMEPLFFASIGFAIPFVSLWTGKRIWRGVVFSLLMAVAKFAVGIWLWLWQHVPFVTPPKRSDVPDGDTESGHGRQRSDEKRHARRDHTTALSGLLLGSAMVARGEIGLLIIEIGYNETSYVSEDAFITAVWAILVNTIIGPMTVGLLVRWYGQSIGNGKWGLQEVYRDSGQDGHSDPSGQSGQAQTPTPTQAHV